MDKIEKRIRIVTTTTMAVHKKKLEKKQRNNMIELVRAKTQTKRMQTDGKNIEAALTIP